MPLSLKNPLSRLWPFLVLGVVWSLQIFLVNPSGEFPLIDDWMYNRSVMTLVTEGRFELCDFQAVSIVAQIVWGALFAWLFGFSFTVLRLSVAILGFFGIVATYKLLLEAQPRRSLAFLGALTMAVNPMYLEFSNTFMTDVPFYTLSMATFLFWIRWLKRERTTDFVMGVLFAMITVLIRQPGLAIGLAFPVACFWKMGVTRRSILFAGVACGAMVLTLLGYQTCLEATVGVPHMMQAKLGAFRALAQLSEERGVMGVLNGAGIRAVIVIVYSGLFLLPLSLFSLPLLWRNGGRSAKILLVAAALFFCGFYFVFLRACDYRVMMPIGSDCIFNFGLGPPHTEGSEYLPQAPEGLLRVITGFSVFGGALLFAQILLVIQRVLKAGIFRRRITVYSPVLFVLTAGLLHFSPYSFTGHFDRYQLFYYPLLMFLVLFFTVKKSPAGACGDGDARAGFPGEAPACSRVASSGVAWRQFFFERRKAMAAVFASFFLLAAVSFFSVAATHDFLSWNRVRWQVLLWLIKEKGISPRQIDGGYEFNGWFNYHPGYLKIPGRNWYWVVDDEYFVSLGPVKGYDVLQAVPYDRWLPPGEGPVFLSSRRPEILRKREAMLQVNPKIGKPVYFLD